MTTFCQCEMCVTVRKKPNNKPIITATQKKINPEDCDYYLELENGKYTVYQEKQGSLKALRYGEPWRDLCGDNLVFYLMVELSEAKDLLKMLGEKE